MNMNGMTGTKHTKVVKTAKSTRATESRKAMNDTKDMMYPWQSLDQDSDVDLFFRQMMYVSGETAEASAETTGMIEEIVRQQVIEMVRQNRFLQVS
jgi:hypothetical protein